MQRTALSGSLWYRYRPPNSKVKRAENRIGNYKIGEAHEVFRERLDKVPLYLFYAIAQPYQIL